jgi:hypothetical protein
LALKRGKSVDFTGYWQRHFAGQHWSMSYRILGCGAAALVLTVMIGQFHFSFNDSVLMFAAFFAIAYFTFGRESD